MEDYPYCGFHPGDQPRWVNWFQHGGEIAVTLIVLLSIAYAVRGETPTQADPAPLSVACEIPGVEDLASVKKTIEAFNVDGPMKLGHYEIVEGARAVMLAEQIWPGDDDNGEVTALVVMSAERFGNGVRVVFLMNGCLAGFQDLPAAAAAPLRGADGKGLVSPYREALARASADLAKLKAALGS